MIEPTLHNGAAFEGMTIGLLGGSFNPAHEGHREMSLHALKRMQLDQVWWLVSLQNPLKPSANVADYQKRMKRARKIGKHPRIAITGIEAALGTQYTADTLAALKKRFPGVNFVWLMGADNLKQFHKWKNWKKIFRLVPIAVFRRSRYPAGKDSSPAEVAFRHAMRPVEEAAKVARTPSNRLPAWIILDNKLNNASASKIRKEDTSWLA